MPVNWTISHPTRLVLAVARDSVGLVDMQEYLDAVVVDGAMPYRKIFDLTHGTLDLDDKEMMILGARIRAYARTSKMGPLAIVASSPAAYERARMYMTLAGADRPMQLFSELHLARKWLDGQEASP
ncbi:MAG TPA: hypothetical protein VFB13_05365 [Reyranella sp.]|jgi:hypothetical protein|nr:hypothetical protein [Reyranella sp.]